MKLLFDLRRHPEYKVCDLANASLERYRPEYFERYGRVGSARWWGLYEQGRISRTELVGQVTYVGPNEEEPEAGELVRIETDRRTIEYDREGYWLDPDVAVGRWIHIEHVKTIAITSTGPLTANIDVRVWVDDASEG